VAGEASSQGICTEIIKDATLIGRKDEKLANAASYVKVIVKQSLGRLKTLKCTKHVRSATHTSMALVWAYSAAPRSGTLNQRQQMSTKRRDTRLETTVLCFQITYLSWYSVEKVELAEYCFSQKSKSTAQR